MLPHPLICSHVLPFFIHNLIQQCARNYYRFRAGSSEGRCQGHWNVPARTPRRIEQSNAGEDHRTCQNRGTGAVKSRLGVLGSTVFGR